jgi:hypothetical protein
MSNTCKTYINVYYTYARLPLRLTSIKLSKLFEKKVDVVTCSNT